MNTAITSPALISAFSQLYHDIKNKSNELKKTLFMLSVLTKDKDIYVVLADDDADDRDLFKEAMNDVVPHINVETAVDGEHLLQMLEKSNQRIPDLIFLDLNMPCKSGTECLQEIRKHKDLKHIPVVIYSTSIQKEDVERTYNHGANIYIQKPRSYKGIQSVLQKLFDVDWDEYPQHPRKEKFVFR